MCSQLSESCVVSTPEMVRLIASEEQAKKYQQASFNSRDGSIDSRQRTTYYRFEVVSIPEMVRLIDLVVNQDSKRLNSFNSRDGSIDRINFSNIR